MDRMIQVLYTLILLPLESIIETLFYFAFDKFSLFHYGGAILFVSLAVNLLTLPVYNRADDLRSRMLAKEKALARGLRHIRATFSGDERFLLLSEYYAQNRFSPFSPLFSSLSILIQIPFFIAAYHFLSGCPDLAGESFFCIRDLSKPDGIVSAGSVRLNLLPLLMTLVNILSGAVYSREAPLREKVQIYVLALLFLLLLYASPSGLVLYWLANNLFGLCKNCARKYLRHPSVVILVLLDVIALITGLYTFFIKNHTAFSKKMVVYACCLIIFCLPLLLKKLSAFLAGQAAEFERSEKTVFRPLFLSSACCLALLAGFALPASMIASSPEDFSFLGATDSPLQYVASSFVLMAGLFVFWPACFYYISGPAGRAGFAGLFCLAALSSLLHAFAFQSEYGFVSITGILDTMKGLKGIHPFLLLAPLVTFAVMCGILAFLYRQKKLSLLFPLMLTCCTGLCFLGLIKSVHINGRFTEYAGTKHESVQAPGGEGLKAFRLTTTGKNVIVIFLDRAIGMFVPYILEDFPALRECFSGFVYYPNTLSFSNHTVKGAPPLYGGYEYTPEAMNRRDGELLKDKHNEAMLALPRLFSEAGWRVTDLDPDWMNYRGEDLTPFAAYPAVTAMNIRGLMTGRYIRDHREDSLGDGSQGADENAGAAIPRFCLLQMLYPPLRKVYYHDGDYYHRANGNEDFMPFLESYSTLCYLDELTSFDAGSDSYILFANETTHEPILMREDAEKGFVPVNALFDPPADMKLAYGWHEDDRCIDLRLYESNCAALLRLGEWFDCLKENSAYDNSRIIIVSDHGSNDIAPFAPGFSYNEDYAGYAALLLVKDFASAGELRTDRSFMTNADVPLLSLAGLELPAVNPFTGKVFHAEKAGGVNVYRRNEDTDAADLRRRKQFNLTAAGGYHVQDDIYVESNWIPLAEWQRMQENLGNDGSGGRGGS